ncbi:hypothetical protein AB1N83_008267 [Pleurotus pulmonarius]
MTSHSPESVSLHSAIQASSAQMSLDADRGSHDVSSAPGPIWEEARPQLFVATDVGAHEPDHGVHEPPGSSPIQPAVPATAEGHSVADEENPNDPPDAPPTPTLAANSHSNPFGHSVLGLNPKYSHPKPQAPPQPGYIDPYDYEKKYPEDATYEEQSENARVWRVYLDEATEFDADMVNKASDGLDLLLVFAGLFSAVLTTFVAQTSQSLSNDDATVSVSLLSELVMIQRAMANGTSIESIPPAETTSGPSQGDIWVNGLWFISLTLSLSTALLAVLARQWLHQYTAITSGTSRDRSLIRQYRFDGLMKWRVQVLIGLLPVLLHIALGLFLAGLIVFLMPLNSVIGWAVASITLLVFIIYSISNILPLVDPQCPYRTPFSDILHVISRRLVPSLLTSLWSFILHPSQLAKQLATHFRHLTHIQPGQDPQMWQSLKEVEQQTANTEDVGARAIAWLLKSTSNPPTTSIALQSLAGSSPAMIEMLDPKKSLILPPQAYQARDAAIYQILRSDPRQETSSKCRRLERLMRSLPSVHIKHIEYSHYMASSSLNHAVSWPENIVSSDISFNVKAGLLIKPYEYTNMSLRFPLEEAIFLGIINPQPGILLLPQDLWRCLQSIGLPGFLNVSDVSPEILVKLYCHAFTPGPSEKVDAEFCVERTSAPHDFMQEYAMNFAYRFHERVEVIEWTLEANIKTLLFISNDLRTSSLPLHEYLKCRIAACNFTVSRCVDIVATDSTKIIPSDLSKSLLKDVVSAISDYWFSDNNEKLLRVVWKLGHEFELLTYQERFQDFQNLSEEVTYLWRFVLHEKREAAYKCFVKLDILSNLSYQDGYQYHMFWIALPAFIEGIPSLSLSCRNECLEYLFQPKHLFTACVGMCYAARYYNNWKLIADEVQNLVSLDPQHPSWLQCEEYEKCYVDAKSPLAPEIVHDDVRHIFKLIEDCLATHQVFVLASSSAQ